MINLLLQSINESFSYSNIFDIINNSATTKIY